MVNYVTLESIAFAVAEIKASCCALCEVLLYFTATILAFWCVYC